MSTFGCRPFDPEEKEITGQLLAQKVGGEHLATRSGGGAGNLTFIEGWKSIELANSLFGFEGWSDSVEILTADFVEQKNGKHCVGVTAVVKVVLKDGTFHEDVGFGQSEQRNKAMAIELAKKEAVTDARKRALRFFGNALGNCIYDKEHLKSVKAGKVAVGDLSYEGLRNGTTFIHRSKPPQFLSKKPGATNPVVNKPKFSDTYNPPNTTTTTTTLPTTLPQPPPPKFSFSASYNSSNNGGSSTGANDNVNTTPIPSNSNTTPNNLNPTTNFSSNSSNNIYNNTANPNNSNNVYNNTANPSNTNNINLNSNTSNMTIRDNMMNNMINNINNPNNTNTNAKSGALNSPPPAQPFVDNTVSPNNPYANPSRFDSVNANPTPAGPTFEDDSYDDDIFAQMADQALQAYNEKSSNQTQANTQSANNNFTTTQSPSSSSSSGSSSSPQQYNQNQPHTPSPSRPQSSPSFSFLQQYSSSPYQPPNNNISPSPQDGKEGTPPDKKRKFCVDVSA